MGSTHNTDNAQRLGGMMKPTRQEIADAAQKCKAERWEPRAKGRRGGALCELCKLSLNNPREQEWWEAVPFYKKIWKYLCGYKPPKRRG